MNKKKRRSKAKKIKRQRSKRDEEEAKLNAGGQGVSGGQNREIDEKIILLSEKISALVAEAEQAGCRGDVEEAQGLMKLCDQLREERDTLRRTVSVSNYGNDYGTIQKAMEVAMKAATTNIGFDSGSKLQRKRGGLGSRRLLAPLPVPTMLVPWASR